MEFKLEAFHRNVSSDDLLEDIRKVHSLLASAKKKLTYRSYSAHGKYSAGTIAVRFGDWNTALKAAKIEPTQEKNISIDDLFDNLRTVWIAKGRQPVFRDMGRSPSRYGAAIYADRFGGWRNSLFEFLKLDVSAQPDSRSPSPAITPEGSYQSKKTGRQASLRLKFIVMRRDRFMCVKCGRAPASFPGLVLEIDHILAWSKGGETIEENLQTLCYDCNRGKTDSVDR
jgi:HNH endonuclease/Homing endonuclease associated repeat